MTLKDYEELVELIKEAKEIGLTIEEVRKFLGIQEPQKEQVKEGII
jgi:DNA-binding transcriptional MerR regulator